MSLPVAVFVSSGWLPDIDSTLSETFWASSRGVGVAIAQSGNTAHEVRVLGLRSSDTCWYRNVLVTHCLLRACLRAQPAGRFSFRLSI